MTKQIDIDELTSTMDASLAEARDNYDTSYLARAMIDVVRPGHIWRAQERNRGTSVEAILEALCNSVTLLVASELEDTDASEDAKIELINIFMQAFAEGVAEKLGQRPTGCVRAREVGHA